MRCLALSVLTLASLATTSHAKTDPRNPKIVIAHRGASGYLPEHTLPAAAYAFASGADFIEPDVVLSKDGTPFVLHDVHLDTTTDVATKFPEKKRADGRYYAIDLTHDELKRLTVHERLDEKTQIPAFPSRFPATSTIFEIPTLEEEILLVQGLNKSTGRHVGLYPEIKAPAFHAKEGQDIAKVVLGLLAKHGYEKRSDNVFLQCFDPVALKRIRSELKSDLKLVQLIADNSWGEADFDFKTMLTEAGIKEIAAYADGIGPWLPMILSPDAKNAKSIKPTPLVKVAHAAGLVVHPYTARADQLPPFVKSYDDMLKMIYREAGADGVFTDHADLAVSFLKAQRLRN